MAYPNDLVRTKNWGTEVLTDADMEGQLDLIINWLMAVMDTITGHKHDATSNEGPKITSAGILDDNVLFAALDDDGAYGLFTGDWSFNEIAFVEDAAPETDADEGKIYTKDSGTQPELFFREESNGDEVQITKAGTLDTKVVKITTYETGTFANLAVANAFVDDNSKPQITEGVEVMTLALTPEDAGNDLLIEVIAHAGHASDSTTLSLCAGLFKDADADAIASAIGSNVHPSEMGQVVLRKKIVTAGAGARTYRIRLSYLGATEGIDFNGHTSAARFDGTIVSCIKITELKP